MRYVHLITWIASGRYNFDPSHEVIKDGRTVMGLGANGRFLATTQPRSGRTVSQSFILGTFTLPGYDETTSGDVISLNDGQIVAEESKA